MAGNFDVIVLGAGNAGIAAATVAREAGRSVLVVEERDPGGTCPLRGCVPKKVLVAAAQVLDTISRAPRHGISVSNARLDWAKLIQRKHGFVDGVPAQFEKDLREKGIELWRGSARFLGPHEIEVEKTRASGGKFVIGTGSKPRKLPIPGFDHVITSDDLLDMPELPESFVFIGGGVIALEFTHVLARAGASVTILEVAPRLLPMIDPDVVEHLADATKSLGVEISTGVKVREIRPDGESAFEVLFESEGSTRTRRAARVVNGAGRVAALEALDLGKANVKLDERGQPQVRPDLSIEGNEDIYFAGDALPSKPQLSALATWEGRAAAHNLLKRQPTLSPDYTLIPSVVFSIPALATVGLTEEAAKSRGVTYEVKRNDMSTWRSARTYAEDMAFAKVLVEPGKSGKVLGAHLAGHGAEEVIHAFALAMRFGITTQQLKEFVYAYPTFHSDLKYLV